MIRVAGICRNIFFNYIGQDFMCATVLVAYISMKQNLFFSNICTNIINDIIMYVGLKSL